MRIDGKALAEDVVAVLAGERDTLPSVLRLGVLMGEGDKATESFVRIKERVADRLQVVIVREVLPPNATTAQALRALERLTRAAAGVIVQLPLPIGVSTEELLAAVPPERDVDGIGASPHLVRPPVAEAISEVLEHSGVAALGKRAVVVGAGRLVGAPATELLRELGADVSVITSTNGSLEELKRADIVILGAGEPGLVKPNMLKEGVVLIDAGTSEAGGRLMGDADPQCAEVASVFTPVPGGIGPIAVAMIFKNLFVLAKKETPGR